MRYNWDIEKNMCWRDGAPGLKPSLFQIRYEDISLRCYDNPERSCAGVYKIETHAWAPRIPWHLTSGEKQMNLKYKELRREAPTRHIMESKHTEAAPPEGRRTAVRNHGKVIARKKYAIGFSIRPLHFSLGTPEDSLNLERNVEVVWRNQWHTSSAQLPSVSFSTDYTVVFRIDFFFDLRFLWS